MDCETSGLEDGCVVYVVSLYDVGASTATSYVAADDHSDTSHIVRALEAMAACDTVVTFNGAAFDFRVLAASVASPRHKRVAARLAIKHVDIMLAFASSKGYRSSLESFATATLGASKTLSGGAVDDLWRAGERSKVVSYCEDDAALTARLYAHGLRTGWLDRRPNPLSRDGTPKSPPPRVQRWALPFSASTGGPVWPSVATAVSESGGADTSWMTSPPDVANAADWAVQLLSRRKRVRGH